MASVALFAALVAPTVGLAQGTRLLRQPTISADHVAFIYAGDLWISDRDGGDARRLTSTPAVESDPHFSPNGRTLAFSSNRSGAPAVYTIPIGGGSSTRLTWYPAPAMARGWTPDGSRVLYASGREMAPNPVNRLWTVSASGGPSELLPGYWGFDGSFSPEGNRIAVDPMSRWDTEWRNYRGGQNTPIILLDVNTHEEVRLPNERTTDTQPVWMGGKVFFLSDRDLATNVWSYDVASSGLEQLTHFVSADAKALSGGNGTLVVEQDGWIHTLDPNTSELNQLDITAIGDFPWAQARWRDVTTNVQSASLSPTGKRALIGARGEIFTVPTDKGDSRNLTRSSDEYDHTPLWSPDGSQIDWFSNDGDGYVLKIGPQDGLTEPRTLSMGISKLATLPTWSPDGKWIAFVDYRSRLQVVDVESGEITTADQGYIISSLNRPQWSPDSKWLAYGKDFENRFYRITVWSVETGEAHQITDALANATLPTWDRDGRHLYFIASTNLGLGADGLNLSSLNADPTYGLYVTVLRDDDPSPFSPQSDEEPLGGDGDADDEGADEDSAEGSDGDDSDDAVRIDFDRIDRRILSIPMPVGRYTNILAGPEGSVFVAQRGESGPVSTLHKFSLADRESKVFASGVRQVDISADGSKLIYRQGEGWNVVGTDSPPEPGQGALPLALRAHIDPLVEWQQMFDEVWGYEKDFFYDPDTHGADWDAVQDRYGPLIPHIRHRSDLTYVLDMVGGELSVGHSFVGGGDFPSVDTLRVGVLGADLEPDRGRWRISRIYTSESWNPGMVAPLDRPGMKVRAGHYLLAVDGVELTDADDPYRLLDGTAGRQIVVQVNDQPNLDGAWTEIVSPVGNETGLRVRGWVEDNRRMVDELSGGRLAYVWVPNTGGGGFTSFNRYYFAQQDKAGAVIDERYNGGGSADDYMVDLMTRRLRAAYNNPGIGDAIKLPSGVLGPKVLIVNERAGSGGDYFPWAFRQLEVGPLIGTRTWGGLVANCAPYNMVDGFRITSPCIGLFHPAEGWIAENIGIPPDIEVFMDAAAVAEGRDPQIERAVEEALRLLAAEGGGGAVTTPAFSRPAKRPRGGR